MAKKPYIKKFGRISSFTIWIVDGNYVRKNIDIEFTNFGQHFRFKFIPKNEFWLDKENVPGEEKYSVIHLLVEHRLMASGMSYNDAIDEADLIELRERSKSSKLKNITRDNVMKRIHKKLIKMYSKHVRVWIVNGELVRTLFYLDFTEGGHDKVYPFIPKNEVWIDDDVVPMERKFILLHELHERFLMAQGITYNKAHKYSNELELRCRRRPRELSKELREALKRNKFVH